MAILHLLQCAFLALFGGFVVAALCPAHSQPNNLKAELQIAHWFLAGWLFSFLLGAFILFP